jgi:hypothetical protein
MWRVTHNSGPKQKISNEESGKQPMGEVLVPGDDVDDPLKDIIIPEDVHMFCIVQLIRRHLFVLLDGPLQRGWRRERQKRGVGGGR